MEEILASIRRIIADDQSLTARVQSAAETVAAQHEAEKAAPPPEPISVQPTERPVPRVARPKFVEDREAGPHTLNAVRAQVAPVVTAVQPPAPLHPEAAPESAQPDFSELQLRPQISETEEEKPVKPAPVFETVSAIRDTAPALKLAPQEPRAVAEPLTSAVTESSVASSFAALFTSRLVPDEKTVADMTRDLLRPMLKTWLDDNLPVMVERLVRAEIERVARGGR